MKVLKLMLNVLRGLRDSGAELDPDVDAVIDLMEELE